MQAQGASEAVASQDIPNKAEKKPQSRRRKSSSKPRRIQPRVPSSKTVTDTNETRGRSLDFLLQRVLKPKSGEDTSTTDKMIDMHETLAIGHHHSPKGPSNTSPGSVESAGSLYSSERPDDNMSDGAASRSPEPFVKIGTPTSPEVEPSYPPTVPIKRSPSTEAIQQRRSPSSATSPNTRHSDDMNAALQSVHGAVIARQESYSPEAQYPSPNAIAPVSVYATTPYDVMACNTSTAIAAMAGGMGLPTMIPTSSIMTATIPGLIASADYKLASTSKPEDTKPTGFRARGIIGSSRAPNRVTSSPSPEERSQYKRPPHTYPALIASAILDSPGHLITLRGIYDYIMNHFPYYKYCHDKSAWQNSIRHNLSLNQCFVKVPRYENAAKSNYWTMTREGFGEFGNENSFKRRRRRGAALAPISAYKAKKYQNEARNKAKANQHDAASRHPQPPANNVGGDVASVVTSNGTYAMPFPPQLLAMSAAGWTPAEGVYHAIEEAAGRGNSRKRSQSPSDKTSAKHPRMVILKQGDGPSLGMKSDEGKRPNSLSSVEEMQGTLNSFSKTLVDSSMVGKNSRKRDEPSLVSATQPWITAAQKNLMASSGMLIPSLLTPERMTSSPERNGVDSSRREDSYTSSEVPVLVEGVEIGRDVTLRYENSDIPLHHFRCRFCTYTYVSSGTALLEQHARVMHHLDITNVKAKAVAAAVAAKSQVEKGGSVADGVASKDSTDRLLSLQNMVSGLNPRSIVVNGHTNAQTMLAAAQAGNATSGFPYSGTFASGLLDDSMMRTLAQQVVGSGSPDSSVDPYSLHRQHMLNSALQQAAAASSNSVSQEQLRMFYQQLAIHNPFLGGQTNVTFPSNFPRQVSTAESEQFKQQLWQYQQKLLELTQGKAPVAVSDEDGNRSNTPEHRPGSHTGADDAARASTSPCRSPHGAQEDAKKSIHGWKKCGLCDFTAKGAHGLDLHYRRTHGPSNTVTSCDDLREKNDDVRNRTPPASNMLKYSDVTATDKQSSTRSYVTNLHDNDECGIPLTSSAYPTPPMSSSPTYGKRTVTPLDLSGAREETEVRSVATSTASTQTSDFSREGGAESRTCRHCDVTFGDEMMFALHMSCHDKSDPFKCTICGQKCHEKYYFNVHLLRGLHQHTNNNSNSSGDVSDRDVTTTAASDDGTVESSSAVRGRSSSTELSL